MKKQLTLLTLLISLGYLSIAQTSLHGKVTAGDNGEELISANVVLYKNGVFAAGVSTDFDGNYSIDIDPGTYDVTVSYIGYPDHLIVGVVIKSGENTKLNIKLDQGDIKISACPVYRIYSIPLIEFDNTSSGTKQTDNDIQNSPFRNIKDLILNVAGVSSANY